MTLLLTKKSKNQSRIGQQEFLDEMTQLNSIQRHVVEYKLRLAASKLARILFWY